ncbi:MAG: hypothetical protein ABJE10_24450 [bacterium]
MTPLVPATSETFVGTSTVGGGGFVTVTVADVLTAPTDAVSVAVPVLSPEIVASCGDPANAKTDTTDWLLDDQFIDETDIACPF